MSQIGGEEVTVKTVLFWVSLQNQVSYVFRIAGGIGNEAANPALNRIGCNVNLLVLPP